MRIADAKQRRVPQISVPGQPDQDASPDPPARLDHVLHENAGLAVLLAERLEAGSERLRTVLNRTFGPAEEPDAVNAPVTQGDVGNAEHLALAMLRLKIIVEGVLGQITRL